jgi:hypothetical protein
MPVSNSQGTLPAWLASETDSEGDAQRPRFRNTSAIAPEAKKWMRGKVVFTQVKLVRG